VLHRQNYALRVDSQDERLELARRIRSCSYRVTGASSAPYQGMRRGLFWVLWLVLAITSRAAQLPLTTNEISLMLRAGYSSNAVLEELPSRRFADVLDSGKEAMLTHAGATPALIVALKSGSYAVSPQEATAAKEKLVADAKRRTLQAEESRRFNTLYQDQLTRQRASIPLPATTSNAIQPLVKGDLVFWHNGSLSRFDDEPLEKKKLIALYFSAHWCGPCRTFTPQLVDYYNRVAPHHPEFEIIFVSSDRSQFAMETYMREANMPWPAIDYQKVAGKEAIRKYAGSGIPCLVVIDPSGKVVSDSFAGKEYLGPAKVLADLDAMFAAAPAGNIAASR
jgi:nucleoredoxin